MYTKNSFTGCLYISYIKAKPLEISLPCPLVLKVVASSYGKIEAITITLLCYLLDWSPINCVYTPHRNA